MEAKKIVSISILASLSVILQILPPIFLTPWFMRIDLVAVPWVVCWILFGLKAAFICSLISIPLIGFLGPFAGGWVGMIMKFVASVWMFLIPGIFAYKFGLKRLLINKKLYAISSTVAIATRDVVTIFFNLYFAIPVFFGLTYEEIIAFFSSPGFQSFISYYLGLIGLASFFTEVAFWNSIQGVIDLYVSLIVGFAIMRILYPEKLV